MIGLLTYALMPAQAGGAGAYPGEVVDGGFDPIVLSLVGIAVVFVALSVIGGFIWLLGKVFVERDEPLLDAPVVASAHSMPLDGAVDSRTIVLLTAAAVAAAGRPVRLRGVTLISRNAGSAWAERGRVSIHASHNVGRSL